MSDMLLCREDNCSCTALLLIHALQNALVGKPKGPKAAEVAWAVTRGLVPLSETKAKNLPAGQLSPSFALPSAPDQDDSAADGHREASSQERASKRTRQAIEAENVLGASESEPQGQQAADAASKRQPTVTIKTVDHQVAPSPTAADPIIHHNGLRDAVQGILAGPAHGQLLMQSSRVPGDTSDSVTLTVCKTRSTDSLRQSSIHLRAHGMPGSCHLYLPALQVQQGAGCKAIGVPQDQLDGLFTLLLSLHMVFQKDTEGSPLPTFHVYYDRLDGIIAFNSADEMWYNAAQDHMIQDIEARAEFWYLTICHELAHHFVHDHNTDFSSYMSKLALEYSAPFRATQINLAAIWPHLWA